MCRLRRCVAAEEGVARAAPAAFVLLQQTLVDEALALSQRRVVRALRVTPEQVKAVLDFAARSLEAPVPGR